MIAFLRGYVAAAYADRVVRLDGVQSGFDGGGLVCRHEEGAAEEEQRPGQSRLHGMPDRWIVFSGGSPAYNG